MRLPRRLQEPKPWEDDAHVHVPIISIKKGHADRKARQQVEYAGMLVALVAFVSACGVLYEWLRKRRRERHALPSLVQRAKESAANNPGRAARGEPTLRLGGEAKPSAKHEFNAAPCMSSIMACDHADTNIPKGRNLQMVECVRSKLNPMWHHRAQWKLYRNLLKAE